MGRGRQKAKQTKIARKLKYLTTDTDYDELAKELRHEEADTTSVDPFVEDSKKYNRDESDSSHNHSYKNDADDVNPVDDDLDDYAKWAAQAAAKATTGEIPATPKGHGHGPIPMPVPSMLHRSGKAKSTVSPAALSKESKSGLKSATAATKPAKSAVKSAGDVKGSKAARTASAPKAAKSARSTASAKTVKTAKPAKATKQATTSRKAAAE